MTPSSRATLPCATRTMPLIGFANLAMLDGDLLTSLGKPFIRRAGFNTKRVNGRRARFISGPIQIYYPLFAVKSGPSRRLTGRE
jgi:hypothetical protein